MTGGCLGALMTLSLGCDLDTLIGTGAPDAGVVGDGGAQALDDAGPGGQACAALSSPGPADKARVVVTGHSTKGIGGVDEVHFLRTASLDEAGFTDVGETLDLDFSPVRIEIVPSGAFAIVLGDEGALASVAIGGDGTLTLVDQVELGLFGMNDLRLSADGDEAFAMAADVTEETAGISVVKIACDGTLAIADDGFFGLRLARSLAFLPGEERAVLLGGQAAFEPVDDDDVRLLARAGDGFEQIGAFDLYGDFVDTLRIAVSPDGSTLIIPNGSPLSAETHQALIADIEGDVIRVSHRVTGLEDAREALFSPDGQTALVTLFGRNRVVVLADAGSGLEAVDEITGIGLAEQMALVARGSLSGTVLVSSVDTDGTANVARLRIIAKGEVTDLGQLDLPEGFEYLPRALAVQP